MNELQVFKSGEFGELGVLAIDGKDYFPATACARILGYINPRDAIKRHCKAEGCVKHDAWVQTGEKADGSPAMRQSSTNYINEGNLYRLIVNSKLPAAERFERWVFDEVLPAIHKQGVYVPDMQQIIAQTASVVATEVVKQLLPLFQSALRPSLDAWHMEDAAPPRRPRRAFGIIAKLDADLRRQVDDMLCSGCTYAEIVQFLGTQGIKLSQMAVCTYARSLQE